MMQGALDGIRAGKLYANNTSGVRGVSWHARNGDWVARIHENGKSVTIGHYATIEEAAEARRKAVLRKYGDTEKETGPDG